MLSMTLIGDRMIRTSVDKRMIPITRNSLNIDCSPRIGISQWTIPWHWRYFFRLSKAMYPGAPSIKILRKLWTFLQSIASCPSARSTGSMNAHKQQTGINKTQRTTRHRWKWMDTSERRSPPVKAWEPKVSSAVVPPSATHQPERIALHPWDQNFHLTHAKRWLACYEGQHIRKRGHR